MVKKVCPARLMKFGAGSSFSGGGESPSPLFFTDDGDKSDTVNCRNGSAAKLADKGQTTVAGDYVLKIQVIYFDVSYGFVEAETLDELIKTRGIIAFRRSGGWVRVGHDPVRGCGGKYSGPERRKSRG